MVGGLMIPGLTVLAYIWKQAWWLSDRFTKMQTFLTNLLDKHEDKDQQRHIDNVIRVTRLETKIDVIGNGKLAANDNQTISRVAN